MNISSNAKLWIHGASAAAISAFVTALGGALTLPEFFNFTQHGMANTAKLVIVPTALAVCAYLKQSPLPVMTVTATETKTTTVDVTTQQ